MTASFRICQDYEAASFQPPQHTPKFTLNHVCFCRAGKCIKESLDGCALDPSFTREAIQRPFPGLYPWLIHRFFGRLALGIWVFARARLGGCRGFRRIQDKGWLAPLTFTIKSPSCCNDLINEGQLPQLGLSLGQNDTRSFLPFPILANRLTAKPPVSW